MALHHDGNRTVIVGYCRTAFAKTSPKKPGHFSDVDPVDLQAPLISTLLKRTGVNPQHVKKIFTGAVHQEAAQGLNIARMNVLHPQSGLPLHVVGTSVDMFCASSMEAIALADGQIARKPEGIYIVTGVQSMSKIPMGGLNPHLNPQIQNGNAAGFMNMAATAENLAQMYGITREEQDAFAIESHHRLAMAQDRKAFEHEIIPVAGLSQDDGVRRDTSMETLAVLKPVARADGTVTAGNASQVTDGATAMMLTSEAFAAKKNLPVLARIIGTGETGLAPEIMGLGPVEATIDALKDAGLTMKDIGAIELNEAFAAQSIAVLREFENRNMHVDKSILNVDGGAIAMGHPLGATGTRLVGHLAEVMIRDNVQYGLATLCVGEGQGKAIVLENPHYNTAKPSLKL